jgi:hypothetical protein
MKRNELKCLIAELDSLSSGEVKALLAEEHISSEQARMALTRIVTEAAQFYREREEQLPDHVCDAAASINMDAVFSENENSAVNTDENVEAELDEKEERFCLEDSREAQFLNPGSPIIIPTDHIAYVGMPSGSLHHHCQYFYHASAYGLAAEIECPVRQSVAAQAASNLANDSRCSTHRIENFTSPLICFDAAYTEMGGSYDECHNIHTTYAYSVIEGLNIIDMVTADRVVSRMAIYSPASGNQADECSYDITGSHFDNLKIAGHPVTVRFTADQLHAYATYSKFEHAYHSDGGKKLLLWGDQDEKGLEELQKLGQDYPSLSGVEEMIKDWEDRNEDHKKTPHLCSAAGHLNLNEQIKEPGIQAFGGIIAIPKFGIIRLAEIMVHKDYRRLTMFRVQMCSTGCETESGITYGGITVNHLKEYSKLKNVPTTKIEFKGFPEKVDRKCPGSLTPCSGSLYELGP